MGRLFWKIFFGFWLTLVTMAAGVGLAVNWYAQDRLRQVTELAEGPRAELAMSAVAAMLEHSGVAQTKRLLRRWHGTHASPVLVVDDQGRDLINRPVPPLALEKARTRTNNDTGHAREVVAADGNSYLLFIPADFFRPPVRRPPLSQLRHQPLAIPLGIAFLASLLFSAGLALYLARPVRHLRDASRKLADGILSTRVAPLIGRRRDEIADLGRDFDHMAAQLQTLVGAQRRLLHDVSHELRSPLARMQVAIGLARQQPNKAIAALDRIEHESERLDTLVAEVLTLSRLESGVPSNAEQYVDIGSLLETVIEDARFEAANRQCEISLTTNGEMLIKGQGELLRRAFENVVRNAVSYTRTGTNIDVSAQRVAGGREARVTVCDQGPGVPEAQVSGLFEPFFRADSAATPGYGLGLAIARRAILAHAGAIRAFNRDPGGLCVEIELPLVTASNN